MTSLERLGAILAAMYVLWRLYTKQYTTGQAMEYGNQYAPLGPPGPVYNPLTMYQLPANPSTGYTYPTYVDPYSGMVTPKNGAGQVILNQLQSDSALLNTGNFQQESTTATSPYYY